MSNIFIVYLTTLVCLAGCKDQQQAQLEEQEIQEEQNSFTESDEETDDQGDIPTTIDEAVDLLEKGLTEEAKKRIDEMKFEEGMSMFHFGSGMGMRNSWGLWGDSPLALHMRELGFTHADDMSAVLLESLWCKRHNKPYRIKEKVEYYKAYWRECKSPPDTARDPRDNSEVEWDRYYGAKGRLHRTIHLGRSTKTGKWVVYEHTTGVYLPNVKIQKVIDNWESDPFEDQ